MGAFERRSVVGSVAGDSHYFVVGLQGLHESFFVEWTRTGYDLKVADTVFEFRIGKCGEFGTRYYVACRVGGVVPQTYLATYLFGGAGCVACHDLHFHTGVDYLADGLGDIGTDRVGNGDNAEEC